MRDRLWLCGGAVQAFYLLLCIRLGGQVESYTKYFYATVGVLATLLLYDVAVLLIFTHRYGTHLHMLHVWR